MSASANLLVRISADITGFDRATRTALTRIKGLASDLEQLGTRLSLGVTLPLAAFGVAALKSAGDIEALKLGLNSITKSAAETERQFKALREVAKLPGLGLEEAVRGATNLQALGFSFEKSRQILLNFGNALASVGRGRDDLNEVIRQLGQLGARGQVTADNLRPIIERVPQVAGIIKREFGGDALGNPAETFKKLGISAQDFIDVITRELGKIPAVTGGIKNDFENMQDSIKLALSDVGTAFAPIAARFINEFAVPVLSKIAELAREFQKLPDSTKNVVLGITAVVGAAPLLIAGLGSVVRVSIETASALTKLYSVIAASSFVGAISNASFAISGGGGLVAALTAAEKAAIPLAIALKALPWVAAAAAIYGFAAAAESLIPKNAKMDEGLRKTTQGLIVFNDAGGKTGFVARQIADGSQKAYDGLLGYVKGLNATDAPAKKVIDSAKLITEHFRKIPFLEKSAEGRILAAQLGIVQQRYDAIIQSIAKFREQGGQQSIFDEKMPQQVDSLADAMKRLDSQTSQTIVLQEALREALVSVPASMFDYARAWDQVALAAAKGRQAFDTRDMEQLSKKTEAELKKSEKATKEFGRQVSLVTNDVARGITDLIFKGGKFKDVMVDALESVAKALVRLAIEKTLTSIAGKLAGLLTSIPGLGKALGGIFGGAAGGVAGNVAGQVGGAVAGNVAGNAIGGAVGNVAGGAISTAAGIGGQAAGAAAQVGISAVAGIVTGAVSAISGVIGNFQFAAMNKSLDLIEKATRYAEAHLLNILEKINTYLPELANIHARLITAVTQGIPVYNAPGDGGLRIAAGSINITIAGSNDPAAVAREMVKQLRLAGA